MSNRPTAVRMGSAAALAFKMPFLQPPAQLFRRQRSTDQEALRPRTTMGERELGLAFGLAALGDDIEARTLAQRDDGKHDRLGFGLTESGHEPNRTNYRPYATRRDDLAQAWTVRHTAAARALFTAMARTGGRIEAMSTRLAPFRRPGGGSVLARAAWPMARNF
jgi:hypothetical protein